MEWYIKVLSNYAVGKGRARRKEYWMFVLFNCIFAFCASILDGIIGSFVESYVPIISLLYSLAVFVPSIAVAVRRLHDTGRSGFWYFIGFIPIVGAIILLVFFCTDGDPRPNKYGANPKGRGGNGSGFNPNEPSGGYTIG